MISRVTARRLVDERMGRGVSEECGEDEGVKGRNTGLRGSKGVMSCRRASKFLVRIKSCPLVKTYSTK